MCGIETREVEFIQKIEEPWMKAFDAKGFKEHFATCDAKAMMVALNKAAILKSSSHSVRRIDVKLVR